MPDGRRAFMNVQAAESGCRTVTSFYSNLVTRPTGRAVRMGVESQIVEMHAARPFCLSVLDFTRVRVMDFSCADEIVAKLLLRFAAEDRPAEAYFVARGLQEPHREAVEAVLERHDLLLVAQRDTGRFEMLGPVDWTERVVWSAMSARGPTTMAVLTDRLLKPAEAVRPTLDALIAKRVVVSGGEGTFIAVPALLEEATAHG